MKMFNHLKISFLIRNIIIINILLTLPLSVFSTDYPGTWTGVSLSSTCTGSSANYNLVATNPNSTGAANANSYVASGKAVVITFPAGFTLTGITSGTLNGSNIASITGGATTVSFNTPVAIAKLATITIVLNGITNHSTAASYQLSMTIDNATGTGAGFQNTFAAGAGSQFTLTAQPTAPTGTNGERCGSGSVALGASGGGFSNYFWYSAISGGNFLGTGSTYNTPSISSTTNYYVEDANLSSENNLVSNSAVSALTGVAMGFDVNNNVSDILVTQLSWRFNATGATSVKVYYRSGTFSGNMLSSSGWTYSGQYDFSVSTTASPTVFDITDFVIPSGQTYGFYLYTPNPGDCNNSATTASDVNIDIIGGDVNSGTTDAFTGGSIDYPNYTFSGAVYYKVVACPSARTTVIATIGTATNANAGTDQVIDVTSATLAGNTPSLGTGTWSVIAGAGTFVDANLPGTVVNSLGAGLNTFRWTFSTCNSSNDDVNITYTTCSAPTTQATTITFSNIEPTQMDVNWTNGNGANRVVKMNTSNSFTAPTDGTSPSANTVWQNSGEQVVFNGGSGPVTITGLTTGTTYWFRVYEKNCTGTSTKYYTSTAADNPKSQATVNCIVPTTQASSVTFANVQTTTMDINWTNGDGATRIVKMNTSNSFTNPTDGTDPSANTVWADAGEQVIFNGTNGPVTITNLASSTTYWFRVYDKNCATTNTKYYTVTATDNPNSQATTPAPTPIMTTIFVSDFETCDATWTTDLTSGTSISSTDVTAPYYGTRHGSIVGGCSGGTAGCYDGSFITPLLTFYPECSYNIKVYARATTCAFSNSLKIMKSATATNVAMKAATGNDIILGTTSPALTTTYQLYTNSFTVSSEESKYIGIQLYTAGSGGCSGASIYIDKVIITKDCPQCYSGSQDANETSVDCGGPCFSGSPVGGTVAPASASYACTGTFDLCISGHSGHIQWQYSSTGGDPWYDISDENNTTLSATVTQTTYFRAKITRDGCTATPAYSNTSTITITSFGSKTWLTTGTTAWGTDGNWSPSGKPTYCDDVTIPSGGTQPTISGVLSAECRNLIVNGTLTITGSANTLFSIYGDVTNSGTITHNSNAYLTIRFYGGSNTIGGAGTWNGTSGPMVDFRANSNYTMLGNLYTYYTTIDASASIALQSYTYICEVASGFVQNGTLNLNTGTLEIRGTGAVYTESLLNHQNGTYFTNYGATSVSLNFNDNDFNDVNRQCNDGYTLTMAVNVNVGNDFVIVGGNFAGSTYTLTVGENNELFNGASGDFINNGTFTSNTGTVVMKGAYSQEINGTNPTTFYNLTINNSGTGVTQIQPVTVSNTLTLTNGAFKLNSLTATVTRGATAAIARTNGYVISELNSADNTSKLQWNIGATTGSHVFPFGTTSGDYIPVTFNNSTATGNVTISTRPSADSDNLPWATTSNVAAVANMYSVLEPVNSAQEVVIDRWWDITTTVVPTTDVTFTYKGAENTMDAIYQTDEIGVQHWAGSYWNDGKGGIAGTISSTGSTGLTTGVNSVTATGLTQFSPYILVAFDAPLPIELISFEAICNDNTIDFIWSTASEMNNDYFTIERSSDGTNFIPIKTVKGAGNSNLLINYSSTDDKPLKGLTYYRLKQTDFDGSFKYSKVIVTCNGILANNKININLYPNPAQEGQSVYLDIEGLKDKDVLVVVYSTLGQQLFSKIIISNTNGVVIEAIDSQSNLNPGVYYVVASSNSNFYNRKLVIK